jgi:hypothetical protein
MPDTCPDSFLHDKTNMRWLLWIKVYCRGGCGMKLEEYMADPVEDCGRKSGRDRYGYHVVYLCEYPDREYRKLGGDDFCHDGKHERLERRRDSSYYGSNRRIERSRSGDGKRYIVLPYRR